MLEAQTKFARALPDFRRAVELDPENTLAEEKVEELTAKLRDMGLLEEDESLVRTQTMRQSAGGGRQSTRL